MFLHVLKVPRSPSSAGNANTSAHKQVTAVGYWKLREPVGYDLGGTLAGPGRTGGWDPQPESRSLGTLGVCSTFGNQRELGGRETVKAKGKRAALEEPPQRIAATASAKTTAELSGIATTRIPAIKQRYREKFYGNRNPLFCYSSNYLSDLF
jgi:hypothetical protein